MHSSSSAAYLYFELACHSPDLCCRRSTYATSLAKRGSVPIRDETGRFIGVRPKTAAERSQRQTVGSGGIFKTAAVQVLRLEKRLMATGELHVLMTDALYQFSKTLCCFTMCEMHAY